MNEKDEKEFEMQEMPEPDAGGSDERINDEETIKNSSFDMQEIPDGQETTTATTKAKRDMPDQVVYRWSYAEQLEHDTNRAHKKRRSGALTFAIVMSACFLLTLAVLVASIAFDGFDLGGLVSFGDATLPGDNLPGAAGSGSGEVLSLQEISAQGKQVVVAISVMSPVGKSTGTGIILTSDGYIATNAHVVENAQSIKVQLYGGREYRADLIGASGTDDLAVIKIQAEGLPVAALGDSDAVCEGDRAVVIGHPAGLEFGWTSTYGFISAINRNVKIRDLDGTLIKKMTLIQTDANVNSGNSGGPMFNDRGEVIGIITLKLTGNYEGMGFAIPINAARPLLAALMETGTVDGVHSEVSSARAVLGITGVTVEKDVYYVLGDSRIYTLTPEQAETTEGSFLAQESGVLVTNISEDSDAKERLQQGDIITALNGMDMTNMDQMIEYLNDCEVGDEVEVQFVRDGQTEQTTVVLIAAQ